MLSWAGASCPSMEDRPSLYSHFMTSAMLASVPSVIAPFFVAARTTKKRWDYLFLQTYHLDQPAGDQAREQMQGKAVTAVASEH